MTVSILVPIYGVERYIATCAESLFEQTHRQLEFIFVNDCTKDDSVGVLKRVMERYPQRAEQVTIVSMEQNSGIGAVRRKLLELVRTEAFLFVDSDDILPLNAVELMVKRMETTGCDIVEGAHCSYADNRRGTPVLPYHGCDKSYQRLVLCQNIVQNNVWGKLFRSCILERVPRLFDNGIDYAEDFAATAILAGATSRAWMDDVVYLYRTDNMASYTKNISRKNVLSYLNANKRVLDFYKQRGEHPLCLEIGALNGYRVCKDCGVSSDDADRIMQLTPNHLATKWLMKGLKREGIGYRMADIFYRLTRLMAAHV